MADRALVCYAVKANPNLAILNLFARLGAGFDIVSGGELERVLAAGGDPGKVVFSGVGKTREEMRLALEAGILCFNVESESELDCSTRSPAASGKSRAGQAARQSRCRPQDPPLHFHRPQGQQVRRRLRARPDLYRRPAPAASRDPGHRLPYRLANARTGAVRRGARQGAGLVDRLAAGGITLHTSTSAAASASATATRTAPPAAEYCAPAGGAGRPHAKSCCRAGPRAGRQRRPAAHPRRVLKHGEEKNFAIVDAAMNDLARPALYDAYHDIVPVRSRRRRHGAATYEIVGPICERRLSRP